MFVALLERFFSMFLLQIFFFLSVASSPFFYSPFFAFRRDFPFLSVRMYSLKTRIYFGPLDRLFSPEDDTFQFAFGICKNFSKQSLETEIDIIDIEIIREVEMLHST